MTIFTETYRGVALCYAIVFLAMFSPYWLDGQVIAPYRQYAEFGIADRSGESEIENHKFSDFPTGYIPAITDYLHGQRSGCFFLWDTANEAGRAPYHLAGFSPVYFPSWILARLTDNPWRFITALSLSLCFLSGLFFILFCRELRLAPCAALIVGTGLAASPFFMYWLTFPMFLAARCWTVCALWAMTRLVKKLDFLGWTLLAFSVYSALLSARFQPLVFYAWMLGVYGLYLACRRARLGGCASSARFVAASLSALLAGVALAFPVYRDLAVAASESARVAPDPSFFTVVLPKISTFAAAARFFVLSTVPEIFGNPIAPAFPFPYDGLSIPILAIFFVIIGLFLAFRKTWGWWLAIGIGAALAFVHPLYVFGVKYLGFGLSRSNPLGMIMLPSLVIAAFGFDAFLRAADTKKRRAAVFFASFMCLAMVGAALAFAHFVQANIRWSFVAAMVFVLLLLAGQWNKPRPLLSVVALATTLATVSFPLMLRQNPEHIATSSPLVEKIRKNLPPGSRFAVAAPGLGVLPANLNATVGLPSLHSYNSLSSKRYHHLIAQLGGEMRTYGRWNGFIQPDYSGPVFWMANIGLMLSARQLAHNNLEYLGSDSGVHLYKTLDHMGQAWQVTAKIPGDAAQSMTIADPRIMTGCSPTKTVDKGDALEFTACSAKPSLFLLSQKFHRDWRASALRPQGWTPVATTEINGVFQGAFLPEETRLIRFEFKPLARFMWIGHVFWFILAAFCLARIAASNVWNNGRLD
ncbi:MAG: hypothetical protein LBU39_06665 [Desulfobulbaceae bacterium]|jgi:hypothetical protein|nr:hypothetical protein [Desulfobulbaceae bacterium]